MKQIALYKYFLIVLLPMFMLSCTDDGGVNIYSAADDVALGKKIDDEFKLEANKSQYPFVVNPAASAYLQGIMNEIIKSKSVKYADKFNYKIQIINDFKIVNAFATAGGYVYVYTGLLKYCDNKAELASVIAHEVAHNDLRHSTTRMTTQYGIGLLTSIILGENPEQWKVIIANITTNLGILKNSRTDEYAADKYAYLYLKDTKYYPAGMRYFFEKALSEEKDGKKPSDLDMLFATHPYSQDRIDRIMDMAKQDNIPAPNEATIMKNEYQSFKTKFGLK